MSGGISEILKNCVNQEKMADVELIVGKDEVRFQAHRFILALVSPFWRSKLYTEGWEKQETKGKITIKLPELDPKLFGMFLEFAYTRKVTMKNNVVFELWKVADQYGVPQLKQYCADLFEKTLDATNCINFYEFGVTAGVEEWKVSAMDYIKGNTKQVLSNEECFVGVKEETVQSILDIEKLYAPEINILKALVRWGKDKKEKEFPNDEGVTFRNILKNFVPQIKLDLMSFTDLDYIKETQIYGPNDLLQIAVELANNFKLNIKPLTRAGPQIQNLKVLLLAGARRGTNRLEHLKGTIMSGGIEMVDIIDISATAVTFEKMNEYDTIVLRSQNGVDMVENMRLGNDLARYVEGGKGLTVIAINSLINTDGHRVKGRIVDEAFIPLAVAERVQQDERELGEIHLPEHPIMEGVQSFKAKDYAHLIGTQDINGGTKIASWNNGFPLITEKTKQESFGTVVCLNFHPMSTQITNDCGKAWLRETDGAKIIANSVQYVGMKIYKN
ncbi:pep-cterm sorting domain-containing protein [Anaeramoeba flamelloides]|uniref:Pep-cterm sorting domain-containing protein n=1 Tax=Anaeramoeba flamelloides TaxID=1746091 RepID=A0ABQ8YBE3_9EUKA|nr:pep-cterm sorting domain-containing protein [Anaeramoeba flamelloides]